MKKLILASACVLVLAVSGAMAQTQPTQPAPGASSQSTVGPGTSTKHTRHMKHAKHVKKDMTTTGQTTGMARSRGTSTSQQPGGRY
jgi:opacity protein-like surface antigen